MASSHPLPLPPHLHARVMDMLAKRGITLPVPDAGFMVTFEILVAAIEELNAESSRTLALSARFTHRGTVMIDGLDRCLARRGYPGTGMAAAVAGILIRAAIGANASVPDRHSRRMVPGIRLLPAWTWTFTGDGRGLEKMSIFPWDPAAVEAPWTDLCPVCREGSLCPVRGETLYGIAATDFLSCTCCGARFVLDSGKFRLVSVGKNRDPARVRLQNTPRSPEEWEAIARGETGPSLPEIPGRGSPAVRRQRKEKSGPVREMTVELGNRSLYFSELPLRRAGGRIRELYLRRKDSTAAVLRHPVFRTIQDSFTERYPHFLGLPIGSVVQMLKVNNDPTYRYFLHEYGDKEFCSFRAGSSPGGDRCGAYLVVSGAAVEATGISTVPFRSLVDSVLGSVRPESCYRDGEPDRCRLNSLFCEGRGAVTLLVCPLQDRDEIARTGDALAARFPHLGVPELPE